MAAKKTSNGNGAPKGYRKVETRIQGFWKPKKAGDYVEGIVGHAVEGKGTDGKPNIYYTLRLADDQGGPIVTVGPNGKEVNVPPEGGMLIGLSGKTMLTFLEEHQTQPVYLIYKGLGVAKRGQNAPKLYDMFERMAEGETE